MQIRFLVMGASLVALPAWAQPVAAPGQYRSVLEDYRAWREPEPVDWRAANRAVGALGGHMGHVRGHGRDTTPASPPATAAPGPAAVPAAKSEPSR